jgi:hypothetical protein
MKVGSVGNAFLGLLDAIQRQSFSEDTSDCYTFVPDRLIYTEFGKRKKVLTVVKRRYQNRRVSLQPIYII